MLRHDQHGGAPVMDRGMVKYGRAPLALFAVGLALSVGLGAGACKRHTPDEPSVPASTAPVSSDAAALPTGPTEATGGLDPRDLLDSRLGDSPDTRILCGGNPHQVFSRARVLERERECWFHGVVRVLDATIVGRERAVRVALAGSPDDGCTIVSQRGAIDQRGDTHEPPSLVDEFLLILPPGLDLPFAEGDVICGSHRTFPNPRLEHGLDYLHEALIARPSGDVLVAYSTWVARDAPPIPGWEFALGTQRTFFPPGGDRFNTFDILVSHAGATLRLQAGAGLRRQMMPYAGGFQMFRAQDGVFVVRGGGQKAAGPLSEQYRAREWTSYAFEMVRIPRPSPDVGRPPKPSPSRATSPADEVPLLGPQGTHLRAQPRDVRLACEVEQTGDQLLVRFDIANASEEPIYVFDHRGRRDADFDILCDGGGGAVHALLGIPPLPPFPIYWRYQPKGSYLAPRSTVRRQIRAEIPLDERNAYWPLGYRLDTRVRATRLTLRVDFLRASKVKDNQYPDEPHGDVDAVSCTVELPRAIELRRRNDKQPNAEGSQNALPLGRI